MSAFTHCSFAWPGTYGHECGKPATLVAESQSKETKNGIYYARRCTSCSGIKGGENSGLSRFVPFDPATHINQWK